MSTSNELIRDTDTVYEVVCSKKRCLLLGGEMPWNSYMSKLEHLD